MHINYFGPFLMTVLLKDLLKKSAPSRVINVSSITAASGKLDINDPNAVSGYQAYSNSKLCLIFFTKELSRKFKGSNIDVNSIHPGFVRTNAMYLKLDQFSVIYSIHILLSKLIYRTAEEGAQTTIHVAVSKYIEGITGEHFDNCRIAWLPAAPKPTLDEAMAKKLWEKSEEIVKLNKTERL